MTKIYVDGFLTDSIETPCLCDDLDNVVLTAAVKDLIQVREIANIIPIPKLQPKIILITTGLN